MRASLLDLVDDEELNETLVDVVNYRKTKFSSLSADIITELRKVMELPKTLAGARQVLVDLLDQRPLLRSAEAEFGASKIYRYAERYAARNDRLFNAKTDLEFIVPTQAHNFERQLRSFKVQQTPEFEPIPIEDHHVPSRPGSRRSSGGLTPQPSFTDKNELAATVQEMVASALQRLTQPQ
jgi:hypothetical protein